MKGQIFSQQMPKMCLKKQNQEEKEQGENRKIHRHTWKCTLYRKYVYTCLSKPVITYLQEHNCEQEFAQMFWLVQQ